MRNIDRFFSILAFALLVTVIVPFGYLVRYLVETGMRDYGFPLVVVAVIIFVLAMAAIAAFLDRREARSNQQQSAQPSEPPPDLQRQSYKHPTTIEGHSKRLDREDQ